MSLMNYISYISFSIQVACEIEVVNVKQKLRLSNQLNYEWTNDAKLKIPFDHLLAGLKDASPFESLLDYEMKGWEHLASARDPCMISEMQRNVKNRIM